MTVTSKFNADWGAGTVLTVQRERAQVLFAHHPARKPVVVPCVSLVITRAGQWEAAVHALRRRRRGSPSAAPRERRRRSGATRPRRRRRPFASSSSGSRRLRGRRVPDDGAKLQVGAHLAFDRELGGDKLRELLSAGKVDDVLQHALRRASRGASCSRSSTRRGSRRRCEETRSSRIACSRRWPTCSRTRFPRRSPSRATSTCSRRRRRRRRASADHVAHRDHPPVPRQSGAPPVPEAGRDAGGRGAAGFDLQYQAALNWYTYQRALKLAESLQEALAVHGCRDFSTCSRSCG